MAAKGNAEGCASCAKWLLIIFNILFCLIGVGLIAAGVYAYISLREYLDLLGNPMLNAPAIVLIAFGCITFIIAAIGCIGACKESPCLLFTFAIIIGILLIAEIAAGIAAFVYRGDIEAQFNETAPGLLAKYGGDTAATDAWDFVQESLNCCGFNGYRDWNPVTTPNQITPPESCGTDYEKRKNCKDAAIDFIEKNIVVVGGVGIAFGLIELLGIVLACCVGCQAKRGTMA